MSQTVVPTFYSTRKRFKERGKNTQNPENEKLLKVASELEKTVVEDLKKSVHENEKLSEFPPELEKTVVRNVKKAVKKTSKAKPKDKKVNKITNYLKSGAGASNINVEKEIAQEKVETAHTPKRNLTPEEITPSKKKPLSSVDVVSSQQISPPKSKSSLILTPQKHETLARKKLLLNSPTRYVSPKKIGSPSKSQLTPQKVAAYENLSNKDLVRHTNLLFYFFYFYVFTYCIVFLIEFFKKYIN